MGVYETFDHTADLGLRVTGSDWDDLFQTAAEGLMDVIVANRTAIRCEVVEEITLHADNHADLLLAWLSEVIFRSETRQRVYRDFRVQVAENGKTLRAMIQGEPIDPSWHLLDHEVKAVTHHGFEITATSGGLVAEVILDI